MVAITSLWTAVLLAGVAFSEAKSYKKPVLRREWHGPIQGVSYPHHRLLMYSYEQELQTYGWKGGVLYWDWTLDAAGPDNDTSVFVNSPIFGNKHGFSGNGAWIPGNFSNPEPGLPVNPPWDVPDRSGGDCIKNGPFAGLKSNLGPGNETSGPGAVEDGTQQGDFGHFDRLTQSTTHSSGHWGVGGLYGTMTDKWQSPRNLREREKDISGPLVNFDSNNEATGNVTLDHGIFIGENVKLKAKVKDVMYIKKGIIYYEYEDTY
ncbi:monophenol monooxygenase [Fusarium bulbicola]|nr:monophenol monooxygenase [Fusarium bulbicola]